MAPNPQFKDLSNKPVLFLDVDGVLISYPSILSLNAARAPKKLVWDNEECFSTSSTEALKYLFKIKNPTLVLSSTWRMHPERKTCFSKVGLPEWEFSTDTIGRRRGDQIQRFIDKHNVTNYVIIDDESCDLNLNMNGKIVKTSMRNGGMNMYHAQIAIDILDGKLPKDYIHFTMKDNTLLQTHVYCNCGKKCELLQDASFYCDICEKRVY